MSAKFLDIAAIWKPGVRLIHSRWWKGSEPAECVVESVAVDHYKGEPIRVVRIAEVGGPRRASYNALSVPFHGAVVDVECVGFNS